MKFPHCLTPDFQCLGKVLKGLFELAIILIDAREDIETLRIIKMMFTQGFPAARDAPFLIFNRFFQITAILVAECQIDQAGRVIHIILAKDFTPDLKRFLMVLNR